MRRSQPAETSATSPPSVSLPRRAAGFRFNWFEGRACRFFSDYVQLRQKSSSQGPAQQQRQAPHALRRGAGFVFFELPRCGCVTFALFCKAVPPRCPRGPRCQRPETHQTSSNDRKVPTIDARKKCTPGSLEAFRPLQFTAIQAEVLP